jgi:rubrerythrin
MSDPDPTVLDLGETVYDSEGNELGTVRGFDEDGFFVTTREGIEALSVEHERAGHEFGQAELMWRCAECGEMGELEGIPEECPNCGAPKEEIYYWIED